MRYFRKFILCIELIIIFSILVYSNSYSQLTAVSNTGLHNMGIYYQEVQAPRGHSSTPANYPNGFYYSNLVLNGNHWIWIKDLIPTAGATPQQICWSERWGSAGWGDNVEIQLDYILKYSPPLITVDNKVVSPPYRGKVDATIKSDVQVTEVEKCARNIGGWITEITRSYANQYHSSYVIWDIDFKFDYQIKWQLRQESYLPPQDLTCYFGPGWAWQGNQRNCATYYGSSGRINTVWHVGDIFPSKLRQTGIITNPNTKRDNFYVNYAFSSPRPSQTKPRAVLTTSNWTGNYPRTFDPTYGAAGNETATIDGEFLDYMYCGHTTLYADKSPTDRTDDIAKPKFMGRLAMSWQLWATWGLNFYDWANQTGIQPPGWVNYMDAYTEESGNMYSYQPVGPYVIKVGQDIRTVVATAIGGIDYKLAKDYGNQYLTWYKNGTGNFDNVQKNALLGTGRDSLIQNLDRAYFAYSKNYNIPDPPWPPDLKVTSGPNKITVEWSYPNANYFKDPDTGVDDFKEWRVYRKKGNTLIAHPDDRGTFYYQLVYSTTNKNETKWEDTGVTKGEAYCYYVTAIDDGSQYKTVGGDMPGNVPLEGSPYLNRTTFPARSFDPSKPTTEQVLIVPNPYSYGHRLNTMNYTGYPNEIHFINLPAYCTLRVYTSTGDLIKTIQHTNGSGQEIWENMRTDGNQQPVSGIYILVVDNAKNDSKDPLPKKIYKFVIVR